MPLNDMLRELDRMMSGLQSLTKYRPLAESVLSLWNEGPRTDVFDEGDRVRVVVEAPGLPKERRQGWAVRVENDSLLLRGEQQREVQVRREDGRFASRLQSESFIRAVPLPCAVERKPESVKYGDGTLTLYFRKQRRTAGDGWLDLRF